MARYREAHAAMQRGDWPEARELLRELWDRSKSYDVAASLAQVEHALGNDVVAARYLTFAVNHLAPKERPETLARYRAALSELEARIGRLEVHVDQPGAEIRLDGELVGVSPLSNPIFVESGEHLIQARREDVAASNRIRVEKGAAITVDLSLARPVAKTSSSSLLPEPPLGTAPPGPLPVEIPSAALARPAESSRSLVPVYVAGGLAVAGSAVAIGFGLAANSDEEKVNALKARLGGSGCAGGSAARATCDAAEHAVSVQRRDALISTIGIGVASASVVAGLGYLLFWPTKTSSTVGLRPSGQLTETSAVLSLTGQL